MRRICVRTALLILLTLVVMTGVAIAGVPETPPGPPDTTDSYSLLDLYLRLTTGAPGAPSVFTEPASAPGVGTMQTLNAIMAVAPALDDTNGVTTSQVPAGKTFWGLTNGEWGPQVGTLPPVPYCPCFTAESISRVWSLTQWAFQSRNAICGGSGSTASLTIEASLANHDQSWSFDVNITKNPGCWYGIESSEEGVDPQAVEVLWFHGSVAGCLQILNAAKASLCP